MKPLIHIAIALAFLNAPIAASAVRVIVNQQSLSPSSQTELAIDFVGDGKTVAIDVILSVDSGSLSMPDIGSRLPSARDFICKRTGLNRVRIISENFTSVPLAASIPKICSIPLRIAPFRGSRLAQIKVQSLECVDVRAEPTTCDYKNGGVYVV